MDSSVILIADRREHRLRKDQELKFYTTELTKLMVKFNRIRQEIAVTEAIVRLIEEERILTPQ